jgi:hypothetical protein
MGRKAIDDWRSSLTTTCRADFDVFLRNLVKKSKWVYPDIGGLSGKHLKGLYELRWKGSNGVPHRIGGYFPTDTDNEFVMLAGWTHNKKKYDPPSTLESGGILVTRRNKLKTEEATLIGYSILTGHTT